MDVSAAAYLRQRCEHVGDDVRRSRCASSRRLVRVVHVPCSGLLLRRMRAQRIMQLRSTTTIPDRTCCTHGQDVMVEDRRE